MIGYVVGNYKIVEKLGEGGMGTVYKGVDLMLEREVAIKALRPELGSQPQVVERFRSEAVTLAKLSHPNIATLYSFFRQGDYFFMVLEYVRGKTLDRLIETHGSMTCEEAIPLFCQMLEGIEHAHRFGVIHRDIKPANMMLTESGSLKVLDFGIARVLGTDRMTRAGNLIGTVEYMSPEQILGRDVDARSDIYSLGMLLYEMLTGRVPFASNSEFELMKAQVEQTPPPPREFAPHIPESVEWAIMCATEKDPDKRFVSAGAFRAAIVESIESGPSAPTIPLPGYPRQTTPLGTMPLNTAPLSTDTAANAPPPTRFVGSVEALTAAPAPTAGKPSKRIMANNIFLPLLAGAVLLFSLVGGLAAWRLWGVRARQRSDNEAAVEQERARQQAKKEEPPKEQAVVTPPQGMAYVPGGQFMMGRDDGDEYERPAHRASVAPFFIDLYEVTCEEYEKFVSETNYQSPPGWAGGHCPTGRARQPVIGVTWDDANAYAKWAHKRLPTEEEWEFAARGADERLYPWGDEWRDDLANAGSAKTGMVEVGKYAGNSPFGAFDMVGNAWEWTASDLSAYPGGQLSNTKDEELKVIRGGSWQSDKSAATTTYRMGWSPRKARDYSGTGFRCVQDIPAATSSR